MSRLMVIDEADGVRVPFLRGILTRSLQDVGLPFDQSYAIATEVRDELTPRKEIAASELKRIVAEKLRPLGEELAREYGREPPPAPEVTVELEDGQSTPFSRDRQRVDLETCGLSAEQAGQVVIEVLRRIASRQTIEIQHLRRITHEVIGRIAGDEKAHRYVVWEEFRQSDRPLLLLVGGAPGSGKSTIANQLAHRLEILRAQSTDMLREVMRMMIPRRLMPVLHASSFKAGEELRGAGVVTRGDPEMLLEEGYLAQTTLLAVACEAVVQRALMERISLLIEGVHVHPNLLERVPKDDDVIVIPVLLAVLKSSQLKRRLEGRSAKAPTRRSRRYLEHFEDIWRLQSFLLAEADRAGIHIVSNEKRDDAIRGVLSIIMRALDESFRGDPRKVFR